MGCTPASTTLNGQGKMPRGLPKRMFAVRLPTELIEAIGEAAQEAGVDRTVLVEEALEARFMPWEGEATPERESTGKGEHQGDER